MPPAKKAKEEVPEVNEDQNDNNDEDDDSDDGIDFPDNVGDSLGDDDDDDNPLFGNVDDFSHLSDDMSHSRGSLLYSSHRYKAHSSK